MGAELVIHLGHQLRKTQMSRPTKTTNEAFHQIIKDVHGDLYDLTTTVFNGWKSKVDAMCRDHGVFSISPGNFMKGQGCKQCGLAQRGAAQSAKARAVFEQKAIAAGYTPLPTPLWRSGIRVPMRCPTHGDVMVVPSHKSFCPQCGLKANGDKMASAAGAVFTERASAVHNNTYDYAYVSYKRSNIKVDIVCKTHGVFQMTPNEHLMGKGCRLCGHATTAAKARDVGLARFTKYCSDNQVEVVSDYTGSKTKIDVMCKTHGIYAIKPNGILMGKRCPECANDKKRQHNADVSAECAIKYNTYCAENDIVTGPYLGSRLITTINCPTHGLFTKRPSDLLRGSGCPSCAGRVSKAEIAVAELLQPHTTVLTQHAVEGRSTVDIFLPEHNIAIEMNGEMFHADTQPYTSKPSLRPKYRHREKEDACTAAGVCLIQLWGSQWENRRPVIERLLLSAIGKDPAPLVGGRECVIDPEVPFREAMEFYEANHPQGKGASNAKNWGLRHKKTRQLVACMSFSTTADRRGAAATSWAGASLTRYATSHRVPGGASKLLNAWRKTNPGTAVMSYSDPMLFAGKTYATLGFTAVKRLDPDYLCFDPVTKTLHHKSTFQRKNLEAWRQKLKRTDVAPFDAATDPRTEFQMEDAMGIKRVWNTGLIRWELPAV